MVDPLSSHGGADPEAWPRPPSTPRRCSEELSSRVVSKPRDVDLPPEIRLKFIKQVYGILAFMLLMTFGISMPFIFLTAFVEFLSQNVWILYTAASTALCQLVFGWVMSCQMRCGSNCLLRGYLWMMKTGPWNYLYLTIFSGCLGILVGFICAKYTLGSVLLIFVLTSVLIVALTIFAAWTKADFTGCRAYILVLFFGLILTAMVCAFLDGATLPKVVAGCGAMLFGFFVVYDTQLIFGSAGRREVEYTLEMYALAAWNSYMGCLTFFVYWLQLLGERR